MICFDSGDEKSRRNICCCPCNDTGNKVQRSRCRRTMLNFLEPWISPRSQLRTNYVRVAKYCTPLKAAQAKKTATQTATKDRFFQTTSGIIQVFCSFSCRRSQNRKVGNKTTAKTVKVIGVGETNDPGDSATILLINLFYRREHTPRHRRTFQETSIPKSHQSNRPFSRMSLDSPAQSFWGKVIPTKQPQQPIN